MRLWVSQPYWLLLMYGCVSDVDECVIGLSLCSAQGSECINTEGGYRCQCQTGFTGEGHHCAAPCRGSTLLFLCFPNETEPMSDGFITWKWSRVDVFVPAGMTLWGRRMRQPGPTWWRRLPAGSRETMCTASTTRSLHISTTAATKPGPRCDSSCWTCSRGASWPISVGVTSSRDVV